MQISLSFDFLTIFWASRTISTYNTSSFSYTHHHSWPKINQKSHQKTHFLQKFQTTYSYSPLNLIFHSWWPTYPLYKYPTNSVERGPKFWVREITIFTKKKKSKIFKTPWNFTILQPKASKHFKQTKNLRKTTKIVNSKISKLQRRG